ncbi:MAG TPA: TIR domain-containing protein [Thermoanaerobaculia bacterium]|nr:TIR domain-containing protein [Thermoanaerobaculia bacterium]
MFGSDIYISYSRLDSEDYAVALANQLAERGYIAALDRSTSPPGSSMAHRLRRALEDASAMVVLVTPGSAKSIHVRYEIEVFSRLNRPIILINFEDSLTLTDWAHLVPGVALDYEQYDALQSGKPSESILYRVERAIQFTKHTTRRKRFAATSLAFVLLVVGVAAFIALLSKRQMEMAFIRAERAQVELEMVRRQAAVYRADAAGLEARVREAQHQVAQLDAQLAKLRDEMSTTGQGERETLLRSQIAELSKAAAADNAKINELTGLLAKKDEQLKQMQSLLVRKTNELEEKTKTLNTLTQVLTTPPKKKEPSWGLVAAIAVAVVVATYVFACVILLFTAPLWILRLYERLSLEKAMDLPEPSGYVRLAKLLLGLVGVDFFAKHSRTRQAWLEDFRNEKVKLEELPPSIKKEYIEHDDTLDVWTLKHRDRAAEALSRIAFLKQRKLFIPLPFEVEPGRQLITQPGSKEFGYLFERDGGTLIEIVGRGGSGKSTLAGQLAKWALDPHPEARLATYYMIPVFVDEEAEDLFAKVKGKLREMLGSGDDLDEDLVRELLRRRRIFVICDGLSERSAKTRAAVGKVFQNVEVNALVITTRYSHDFGTKPVTKLMPRGIDGEGLSDFVAEYFLRPDVQEDLSLKQAQEVRKGVIAVFKDRDDWPTVTPLIVTLIADQAVDLWRRTGSVAGLSGSAADAILSYLRRLNPKDENALDRVEDDAMIAAARVLAKCCLGTAYAPGKIALKDARAAVTNASLDLGKADVIRLLISNGVLDEDKPLGTTFVRFNLDPVAEYLAAMYWIDHLRSESGWNDWIKELETAPGYPFAIYGFLAALEDCAAKYKAQFNVPDLLFTWLKRSSTQDMSIAVA